jgi:cytochrome c
MAMSRASRAFMAATTLVVGLVGGLPAPTLAASPVGDAQRGAQLYMRCAACHALSRNSVGPRHCGLFGRRAGTLPGFDYSRPMKQSGITWDEKTLDHFLAAPTKVVPDTDMTYAGVPDRRERHDLIAYLKQAQDSAECQVTQRR